MSDKDDDQPNDETKTPRLVRRTLDALRISNTSPTAEDMAFLAREFILCTLPHRDPGDVPGWSRQNGNLTLGIQPGYDHKTNRSYGYPYGTIPRLLLAWITTEAVRTQSRRLELGASLNGFMAALGLSSYTGRGPRGDATRLRDQMERLFNALISFEYSSTDGKHVRNAWLKMHVAPEGEFWWSARDTERTAALWGSWIELGEQFFKAIISEAVPLDLRVLRHIKQSPLALDLYAILNREAFRANRDGKPRFLAWEWLHTQIGSEYGEVRNFRSKALVQIQVILDVHPGLILTVQKGGQGKKSGIWISNLSEPSIPREVLPASATTAGERSRNPNVRLVPKPVPPSPPPPKELKPTTVTEFRRLYPNLDPMACKKAFDTWLAGKGPEARPKLYDRAFMGFARKWIVGKLVVNNP
jgi:hypothetical protein